MRAFGAAAHDTICALSSGNLPSGVAVVRVSGPQAPRILEQMTGWSGGAGHFRLRSIRKRNGEVIDRGLALSFQGPESYTGEDVVEFHFHGGPAVVRAGLAEICSFPSTRMAEPGEFSRRAFVNGKIDLVSAENLADLIEAETEAQRRLALANSRGEGAAVYRGWRKRLLEARALLEAELDFSDEEDVPGSASGDALSLVGILLRDVESRLRDYARAEIIRGGYRVVLLGAPNAGKSSLLNALARRDVAIVSAEPGTTRDLIEVSLDLNGLKVLVTDTAGLRDGGGPVENEGMARARASAEAADLVLWLSPPGGNGLPEAPASSVVVHTKADLFVGGEKREGLAVSALSGLGLPELIDAIAERASRATAGDMLAPTHWREAALLQNTVSSLRSALVAGLAPELSAEFLRMAADDLGRIAGDIDVEDILGVIFSRFCVGK